jgi:rfaE bifunctional protein kinase chain/domain
MNHARTQELLQSFARLRIAVVGDFCLDRYLEIDAAHRETSIETGLPVYKVDRVRSQPGAAGTVLSNLAAMGVGTLIPVGFCGDDGEGFELERALAAEPCVDLSCFVRTPERRTFTYCKPLLLAPGELPRELNRLDSKNWTPTPGGVSRRIASFVHSLSGTVDAVAVMNQVDVPGTGVVTAEVLAALSRVSGSAPVVADSRSGFASFPPMIFKMNRAELCSLKALGGEPPAAALKAAVASVSAASGRASFVTLAGEGIVGCAPGAAPCWVPSLPVRGPIDVVGAGDSVTAALSAALAAGASLEEAMALSMLAASVTVHQVGTTGAASSGAMLELAAAAR